MNDFDFIVIGAGSGGLRAARVAAALGARVAIVESQPLGGTCVNAGCVPKKLFTYASRFAAEFKEAEGYGWTSQARSFDWQRLVANKDAAIARLNGYYAKLLDESGVTLLSGTGRFLDQHSVAVADRRYRADHFLIATGAAPQRPGFPGQELGITSDAAFQLPALPQRIIVVGGGYIAVEFASIFHGLGRAIELIHRGPSLLKDFDTETAAFLTQQLRQRGLGLRLQTTISAVQQTATGLGIQLQDGTQLHADLLLLATGRIPNTRQLELSRAGIALRDSGAIAVDEHYCTNVRNIYAVGDVTGRLQLTPVAIAEGTRVASRLFGSGDLPPLDYANVPTTVFTQPNLGSVGLTEAQAMAQYPVIRVYTTHFSPLKHMLSGSKERVFMKLLVDAASDRVLGAHMVGADAGEIIQCLAVAVQAGASKAQFDATLAIHPTSAEEFVTMRQPTRVCEA